MTSGGDGPDHPDEFTWTRASIPHDVKRKGGESIGMDTAFSFPASTCLAAVTLHSYIDILTK